MSSDQMTAISAVEGWGTREGCIIWPRVALLAADGRKVSPGEPTNHSQVLSALGLPPPPPYYIGNCRFSSIQVVFIALTIRKARSPLYLN